jgi:hypothetical protein
VLKWIPLNLNEKEIMTFLNWYNGKYSYDMESRGSESISSAEQ